MRGPFACCVLAALAVTVACTSSDGDEGGDDAASGTAAASGTSEPPAVTYPYGVPLDPASPWPKFRADAPQTGFTPVDGEDTGAEPWTFETGNGVFSSPVVDGDGNVYVGSADHVFYALDARGQVRWQVETGEIIDSAALLDDQGRVYVPSGDGVLYALDRDTGEELWRFRADPPEARGAFIDWFEGNVAILADGTLVAPNDNFCVYAVDRDTGQARWCVTTSDQTWSLPAVDPDTNRLFFGTNFPLAANVLAVDGATGEQVWAGQGLGSMVASPLLSSASGDLVVIGGFDGIVRALDQATGEEVWTFGARDHIYASPAQQPDGTIVQPSADGSVYALDPTDGSVRWQFDTLEPIRSSPAVDSAGRIYVGSGSGRLYVLEPDGRLRWSIQLIDGPRSDLNASPALGPDGVVIAGESGQVFLVPYDYCLRPDARSQPRCAPPPALPPDTAELLFTTRFGSLLAEPPAEIDANEPLAFSLLVRQGGTTQLALLESTSVQVELDPEPEVPAMVDVSGDRRFLTVVPTELWTGPGGGRLTVRVRGQYLVDLAREGLRFSGGRVGGEVDQTFELDVRPWPADTVVPLGVPAAPGEPGSQLELYRLAAPMPTILPSYNQIGFASIHYFLGIVEGTPDRAVAWAVGGRSVGGGQGGEIDPGTEVRFPLQVRIEGDLVTLVNEQGFQIVFNGFPLPFDFFRVASRVDPEVGLVSPAVNAKAVCGRITFYGQFLQLLGYCNPTTDLLDVFGGAELRPLPDAAAPPDVGTATFVAEPGRVTARLDGSGLRADEHVLGVLLVDAETGVPVPLAYTDRTSVLAGADGAPAAVSVALPDDQPPLAVRAYLMVDTTPAAVADLTVGGTEAA